MIHAFMFRFQVGRPWHAPYHRSALRLPTKGLLALSFLFIAPLLRAADPPTIGTNAIVAAAINGTHELNNNARESALANQVAPRLFDDRKDLPALRFANRGDVARYAEQRPWVKEYLLLLSMERRAAGLTNLIWPHAEDAPALRELLSDADPAFRGLAAEALAILHEPDDVPRIGKLLSDTAESVQALGWNTLLTTRVIGPKELGGEGGDALDITRSWQPRRVCAYAKAALKLMTGQDLDDQNFGIWWQRNQGGRNCVWYWQERLHRDLAVAEAFEWPDWRQPGGTYDALLEQQLEQHRRDIPLRFEAVRHAVSTELAKLPPEVEVKVRLLAVNRNSSKLGSALGQPLMGRFECRRVSSERLLELLERKNLWDDVDWDEEAYSTVVVQVAGQAEQFFGRKDVTRLRAVQAREHELKCNGPEASLIIGISRLLPPAAPGDLDNPDTQDGALRKGVQTLTNVFARGDVARELVVTGLPRNWEFLAEQFFAEQSCSAIPDLRACVLQELASPPTNAVKREALARLLLDKRFDSLWMEPRAGMADDQHRRYAFRAVNAYAGKEALTSGHDQGLADHARGVETLGEVKEIVRETLVAESTRRDGK